MTVALHVEIAGTGPALCLLHGFGGSARNFRPQVRAFRDMHRVVTFDARGHARSEAPLSPDAYTVDACVADVGDVLDRAGADVATIGGVSMGAAVALEFGLRHPERVSALILASFPSSGAGEEWAIPFAEAIERDGLDAAGSRFVWGGARFDRAAAELIRKGFMEHAPHALAAILRQVLPRLSGPDPLDRAAAFAGPALILAGTSDPRAMAAGKKLAQAIPRATYVEIEGAGHVVNLQAPAAFNAAVAEFISKNKL